MFLPATTTAAAAVVRSLRAGSLPVTTEAHRADGVALSTAPSTVPASVAVAVPLARTAGVGRLTNGELGHLTRGLRHLPFGPGQRGPNQLAAPGEIHAADAEGGDRKIGEKHTRLSKVDR